MPTVNLQVRTTDRKTIPCFYCSSPNQFEGDGDGDGDGDGVLLTFPHIMLKVMVIL